MIIRKLRKAQMQLALSLVVALSGVFVCNSLCDLGILDIRMHSGKSTDVAHNHEGTGGHGHTDINSNHHADHSSDDANHAYQSDLQQQQDKDECCDEETSLLLASLVKYDVQKFETEKVPVLLYVAVCDVRFTIFSVNKNISLFQLNSSLSPPIRGAFRRILYQSFLC